MDSGVSTRSRRPRAGSAAEASAAARLRPRRQGSEMRGPQPRRTSAAARSIAPPGDALARRERENERRVAHGRRRAPGPAPPAPGAPHPLRAARGDFAGALPSAGMQRACRHLAALAGPASAHAGSSPLAPLPAPTSRRAAPAPPGPPRPHTHRRRARPAPPAGSWALWFSRAAPAQVWGAGATTGPIMPRAGLAGAGRGAGAPGLAPPRAGRAPCPGRGASGGRSRPPPRGTGRGPAGGRALAVLSAFCEFRAIRSFAVEARVAPRPPRGRSRGMVQSSARVSSSRAPRRRRRSAGAGRMWGSGVWDWTATLPRAERGLPRGQTEICPQPPRVAESRRPGFT